MDGCIYAGKVFKIQKKKLWKEGAQKLCVECGDGEKDYNVICLIHEIE